MVPQSYHHFHLQMSLWSLRTICRARLHFTPPWLHAGLSIWGQGLAQVRIFVVFIIYFLDPFLHWLFTLMFCIHIICFILWSDYTTPWPVLLLLVSFLFTDSMPMLGISSLHSHVYSSVQLSYIFFVPSLTYQDVGPQTLCETEPVLPIAVPQPVSTALDCYMSHRSKGCSDDKRHSSSSVQVSSEWISISDTIDIGLN